MQYIYIYIVECMKISYTVSLHFVGAISITIFFKKENYVQLHTRYFKHDK